MWGCARERPATFDLHTTMKPTLKSIIQLAVCLTFATGFLARAEDTKIDLTGTWKISFTNQNGQVRETTIVLKLEGDKLTGTVSGRNLVSSDSRIQRQQIRHQIHWQDQR
jgi:hypothetical protein